MNHNIIDTQILDDYLEGRLEAREMHFIERAVLDDPFVAEAMAGLAAAKDRTRTISSLQRQLHERVAERPQVRKMWGITTHRLSIAATAAVLFISAGLVFWMVENNKRLATANNKQVDVALLPQTKTAPVAPAIPVPADEIEAPVIARNTIKRSSGSVGRKTQQSAPSAAETASSTSAMGPVAMSAMTGAPEVSVRSRKAIAAPANSFAGSVLNEDRSPVRNATLLRISDSTTFKADLSGSFKIGASDKGAEEFIVSAPGYISRTVQINPEAPAVIVLKRKENQ